jgi:membrane protease YdiL (CAAX protease family)
MILVPVSIVFFFGFSSSFKKGNFLRGLLYLLPLIVLQAIILGGFFSENLGNPEANWKPWYLVVYGVFSVVGVGVREECIFRATIQNILAKKYANSVNGIWITAIVSALIFGLTHVTNVLFGVEPLAVLTQVLSAACLGILLGAVYLRSGSIWALILIHTLIDIAGLAGSTFLYISDIEDLNQLSWSWGRLIIWLVYIGFAAFLLRPSKCKQICESFCFTVEETEEVART